jgi:large subunit ribosomal protein L33
MGQDECGLTAPLSEGKFRIWQQGPISPVSRRASRGVVGAFSSILSHASCLPAEVAGHDRRTNTMREIITLQCPECKNRNYSTTKNKKTTTGRLEFSKFCNTCRKHTAHKETK